MRQAFFTLIWCIIYAPLPAKQPSGLPMGTTDLITDKRLEAYKVERNVYKTVVLSESFFVPAQAVHAQFLKQLSFKNVAKTESRPQSPDFVTNYENWSSAISKYKTQLNRLKEQLNRIKIKINCYADGAVSEKWILKSAYGKFHELGKTLHNF
jgi:hypothetical protein